jgi:mersacidin/lichenicidin family type 2 lantibiotic
MVELNVIRAWKDDEFAGNLGEIDRKLFPENPAGLMAITDEEIDGVAGGTTGTLLTTLTTLFTFITGPTVCACSYGVEDCPPLN